MYKSSGKKNRGLSKGYFSDATYSDEELDDFDSPGVQSPDFYSADSSSKAGYYNRSGHQNHGSSHGKTSNNYYASGGNNKSRDHYYSAAKSSDYYGHNMYGGGKSDFYKHNKGREPAYKNNKYQTIVLKIQIHCNACIRKVKKAIADLDGVESINVDQKQKKVSVTGYIDPKEVLKKVSKTGKSVELVGSKDSSGIISHMNTNKAMLDRQQQHQQHQLNANASKAYTIQVEKASRPASQHNAIALPYIHRMTPGVRSDMDYMFSDDNANSCSIM